MIKLNLRAAVKGQAQFKFNTVQELQSKVNELGIQKADISSLEGAKLETVIFNTIAPELTQGAGDLLTQQLNVAADDKTPKASQE